VAKIEKLIRQSIPVKELPEDVFVEKTPFDEKQAIDREIDNQKKKDNPDFKGAFHEKKYAPKTNNAKKSTRGKAKSFNKGNSKPGKKR
jgi:ATP-dependent RNA helicase RhlE